MSCFGFFGRGGELGTGALAGDFEEGECTVYIT